jgi:hypothetical protein
MVADLFLFSRGAQLPAKHSIKGRPLLSRAFAPIPNTGGHYLQTATKKVFSWPEKEDLTVSLKEHFGRDVISESNGAHREAARVGARDAG